MCKCVCVCVCLCLPGGWEHWQVFALVLQMQLGCATAVCVRARVFHHLETAGMGGSAAADIDI